MVQGRGRLARIEPAARGPRSAGGERRTANGGKGWAMRMGDAIAPRLDAAENGSMEVSEVELTERGRRLSLDPPAMLLPATMKPGQTPERSGSVRVFDAASGGTTATNTYEQTLPPPSRTMDGGRWTSCPRRRRMRSRSRTR